METLRNILSTPFEWITGSYFHPATVFYQLAKATAIIEKDNENSEAEHLLYHLMRGICPKNQEDEKRLVAHLSNSAKNPVTDEATDLFFKCLDKRKDLVE